MTHTIATKPLIGIVLIILATLAYLIVAKETIYLIKGPESISYAPNTIANTQMDYSPKDRRGTRSANISNASALREQPSLRRGTRPQTMANNDYPVLLRYIDYEPGESEGVRRGNR